MANVVDISKELQRLERQCSITESEAAFFKRKMIDSKDFKLILALIYRQLKENWSLENTSEIVSSDPMQELW